MTGGWSGGLEDLVYLAMVVKCIIRIIGSEVGSRMAV